MINSEIQKIDTKNKFLIDWFSFTSKIHDIDSIIKMLGLEDLKFEEIYGFQGYRNRQYFDGISIHYNSENNAGVWVEMSGQGCRNFETYSKITFDDLFIYILCGDVGDYHVTRLDVAYDDFKRLIPLKKLSKQVLNVHFISKFKEKSCTVTQCAGRTGITVDLGSRKSAVKFRVYDKAFERGYHDEIKNCFSWTRWEAQLRDERALEFIRQMQNDYIGNVFKGVLLNYFRPVDVNKSDSNKRRWNISKWYLNFIGAVEKISLFTKCKTDYNLAKCEHYVYCQAGNALDTLIKIKGVDTVVEELRKNKPETSEKYKELYNQYQQGRESSLEVLDVPVPEYRKLIEAWKNTNDYKKIKEESILDYLERKEKELNNERT